MIDFHCHLDLFSDPTSVAARADAAGIYVLSVTTTPKAWRGTSALAKGHPRIRTALGLHPQLAHDRAGELSLFEALVPETRYLGEIGLDGSPGYGQYAHAQLRVFERILAIARNAGGRILTVHSRRAAREVLSVLRREGAARSAVLHWFSGTQRQLGEAIALGCWFSVGQPMLESEHGRRLVSLMPRERVLTETDGPFGTVANRPLEPGTVTLAVEHLARLWHLEAKAAHSQLAENLRNLLTTVAETEEESC